MKKSTLKLCLFSAVFCMLTAVSYTATITVSMVRTTMPQAQWNAVTSSLQSYETLMQQYAGSFNYTYNVNTSSNSVDFVYGFNSGWNWPFYKAWRDEYIAAINAAIASSGQDPGFRWTISVDGQIDGDANPWRDVSWLTNVEVYDGEFLSSQGLGWLWAPNWSPEGQFWAWAYNLSAWGWVYVWGNGYYYNQDEQAYFYNWPGTAWAFNFSTMTWVDLSE